jgi:hypothetical protein
LAAVGRKEEKGKEGGKNGQTRVSKTVSRVRASMQGPGACRGPGAHGRDEVLVSSPDGLVQNPWFWESNPGLAVGHVRKHGKVPVGLMHETWVGLSVFGSWSDLVILMTSFRLRYVSARLDAKWWRYEQKSESGRCIGPA